MKKYNTPKIKEAKSVQLLTSIWIVPLLAMIIALWLVWQYYSKIGPTIKISFKANAGLIANQSQIKLRDVIVGMVTKISLSNDGSGVIVQAQVNKEVSDYLNAKAKFWIVHPDVGSHGVSGLDTLLSGSYIKLNGVKEEETQHIFMGLESPFIDRDAKGAYYLLSAPNSYDITEGSNVYYRMIKIGRVERVGISPDGKQVNFTIFVEEKYNNFINEKSQFYTRSNFTMDFSQGKMDFNIATMSQIIHGGISIYTPIQSIMSEQNSTLAQERVFPLYKSLAEMKSKHFTNSSEDKIYTLKFNESITKLEIGSPVEFNGFQIGYITDIESRFDAESQTIDSRVYALIHTKTFEKSQTKKRGEEVLASLVESGLKAKLDSALPMVGAQFVNLVFDKNSLSSIRVEGEESYFPTTTNKAEPNILDELKNVVVKIEKLKLEKLLNSVTTLVDDTNPSIQKLLGDLDSTVVNLNSTLDTTMSKLNLTIDNVNGSLINNLDGTITRVNDSIDSFGITIDNVNRLTSGESLQQLPNEITIAIQEVERTLREVQTLSQNYGADSQFSAELSATLQELSLAAESIERVSRKLEKKPNALLLGDD